jgi:hypothetical protein
MTTRASSVFLGPAASRPCTRRCPVGRQGPLGFHACSKPQGRRCCLGTHPSGVVQLLTQDILPLRSESQLIVRVVVVVAYRLASAQSYGGVGDLLGSVCDGAARLRG